MNFIFALRKNLKQKTKIPNLAGYKHRLLKKKSRAERNLYLIGKGTIENFDETAVITGQKLSL